MDTKSYLNKITSEHSDKQNFNALLTAILTPVVEINNTTFSLIQKFDIDVATGVQLDVLGEWIGVSRNLTVPLTGVYLTLDTDGLGLDSGIMPGPYDPLTGLIALPDDYYRLLLFAKILNNQWDGTKQSAYSISNLIFNVFGYRMFIVDYSDLSMDIGLFGSIPIPAIMVAMLTQGFLDFRPATVRIGNYIYPAAEGPILALDTGGPYISDGITYPTNPFFGGLDNGHFANIVSV